MVETRFSILLAGAGHRSGASAAISENPALSALRLGARLLLPGNGMDGFQSTEETRNRHVKLLSVSGNPRSGDSGGDTCQ